MDLTYHDGLGPVTDATHGGLDHRTRLLAPTRGPEGLVVYHGPDPVAELASLHPAWAKDLALVGPWRPVEMAEETASWSGWLAAGPVGKGPRVVVCPECSSSLDVAWTLTGAGGLTDWDSVLCGVQTAGRGQLRRAWRSYPGNVLGAWAWPRLTPALDRLAPLLAGYLLAESLSALGAKVRLKWPNDLLQDGRKVGGVLVEERQGRLVVGVGLNLAWAPPESALRDEHALPAGVLTGLPPACSGPLGLWNALVESGQICYLNSLQFRESSSVITAIESLLAWRGKPIRITGLEEGVSEGHLLGLAEDGALKVSVQKRERLLYSGSIHPC